MPRCTAMLALATLMVASCGESAKARRYSRRQLNETLASLETPGLLIGEFARANKAVVDGDTIKVHGLDTSLRLLAIDTEETFKSNAARVSSDADFEKYLTDKRGDRQRPVKSGTPMGERAKQWARDVVAGVDKG